MIVSFDNLHFILYGDYYHLHGCLFSLDPVVISENIINDFCLYLKTALNISPKYAGLREQFYNALDNRDLLFRGPYLQGLPPYQKDQTIIDLINNKVLPNDILPVPFLSDFTNQLYWHQCETIRRLRAGRNVVLASGTGSGKTLAFLIPIISEILENPALGIHAMLLYPMNALINDQLKTMRRILKDIPSVRFGRYVNIEITPTKEAEARRLYPEALPHEVVSREVFRDNPPHILITNYAMLEHLLLRVDDSPLLNGPWKFIVLDEAHTYSGAKGSEVALLLRRLYNRVKRDKKSKIQYIATSATLGKPDKETKEKVADFAGKIFNADFTHEDVIIAKTTKAPAYGEKISLPDASIYTNKVLLSACSSGKWTSELTEELQKSGFPEDLLLASQKKYHDDFEAALYYVFSREPRVERLREMVEKIPDLKEAALAIFKSQDENAVKALTGFVRICSLASYETTDIRLVPCRYHFFVRGLDGAYITLTRGDYHGTVEAKLLLEPHKVDPVDNLRTLELRICRKCGQPFAFGYHFEVNGKKELKAFGSKTEERGRPMWFTWDPPAIQSIDEEDEFEEEADYEKITFCPQCGCYDYGENLTCNCEKDFAPIFLWLIKKEENLKRCPACGGANSVTRFRADSDAAQTVIAESFYKQLPESNKEKALYYPGKGRKLLVFSDSRQNAAYFAPYLEGTHTE